MKRSFIWIANSCIIMLLVLPVLAVLGQDTDSTYQEYEYVPEEVQKPERQEKPEVNRIPDTNASKNPKPDKKRNTLDKLRFSPNLNFASNRTVTLIQGGLTVAYKVKDNLLVGPGIDYQRFDAKLIFEIYEVYRPLLYGRYYSDINILSGSRLMVDMEYARNFRSDKDKSSKDVLRRFQFDQLIVSAGLLQRFSQRITATLSFSYDLLWTSGVSAQPSPFSIRQRFFF